VIPSLDFEFLLLERELLVLEPERVLLLSTDADAITVQAHRSAPTFPFFVLLEKLVCREKVLSLDDGDHDLPLEDLDNGEDVDLEAVGEVHPGDREQVS